MMRTPELRSPLARAVVPVVGGVAFFAILGGFLWGAAVLISRNSDKTTSSLTPTVFEMGGTKSIAASIDKAGPLILPDLLEAGGRRTIVLDHSGSDPQQNWQILMAYPADREVSCKVELIKKTRTFTDCEHRTLFVDQLARPPQGVNVIVARDGKLSLDLRPDSAQPSSPLPPSPPTS